MKKSVILFISFLIFAGCAKNSPSPKQPARNKDILLLNNYKITQKDLMFYKNCYYFVNIEPDGISINKLDKNYNLLSKKIVKLLIEPKKSLIKNGHLYILGYDAKKQKPVVLDFLLKNLSLIRTLYLGKKYSIPADFFVKKEIYTAVNVFNKNTKSDIYIYKNTSLFSKIASPKKESAKFIMPFNKNLLVTGNISFTNDDILIVLINKKGRIIQARRIDLGMDDYVNRVVIKNGKIFLYAVSTDYMGGETDYILVLDKNLNILKSRKNLEFKELPVKFRT